jgi:hypothetical protein
MALRNAIDQALEQGCGRVESACTEFVAVKVLDAYPGATPVKCSWYSKALSFGSLALLLLVFLGFVGCAVYGMLQILAVSK